MTVIDDDGKLKRKFSQKKANASLGGVKFSLSFREFRRLVRRAGLKSSDLGFSGNGYDLARYRDRGPYSIDNCRFITHAENMKELVMSKKAREKIRESHRKRNDGKLVKETPKVCSICGDIFYSVRRNVTVCDQKCKSVAISCALVEKNNTPVAKIQRLRKRGLSSYKISRIVGVARNTVMNYW